MHFCRGWEVETGMGTEEIVYTSVSLEIIIDHESQSTWAFYKVAVIGANSHPSFYELNCFAQNCSHLRLFWHWAEVYSCEVALQSYSCNAERHLGKIKRILFFPKLYESIVNQSPPCTTASVASLHMCSTQRFSSPLLNSIVQQTLFCP